MAVQHHVPEATTQPLLAGRRVLLVCTRDPRGRLSGRKMVLRTIMGSTAALDMKLTIAYFGSAQEPGEGVSAWDASFVALPGPSLFERIGCGISWLLSCRPSLNEGLYRSRKARAELARIARDQRCEFVVTDMIRTAQYAPPLDLPWIADLDDLLSRRYRFLAADCDRASNLLGYYRWSFGLTLLRLTRRAMPWVLKREAAEIERREIEVANSADVTTLVSASEAELLARVAGRPVAWAPMTVAGPRELPPLAGRPRELVFLGGLDYGPNLRSVLQFDKQIRPALQARGIDDLRLHVIGQAPEGNPPLSEAVVLEGYVDDLEVAMPQYRAMLVPEVPPGGVKTKMIVGALNGNLLLAHRSALEGMGLQPGKDVWAWDGVEDLADLLLRLRRGELNAEETAKAARHWASTSFGEEKLREAWRSNFSNALGRSESKTRVMPGAGTAWVSR